MSAGDPRRQTVCMAKISYVARIGMVGICAVCVLAAVAPKRATAASPGGNGQLVWTESKRHMEWGPGAERWWPTLFLSDANGQLRRRVAYPAVAGEFSPDGKRLAYTDFGADWYGVDWGPGASEPVIMLASATGGGASSLGVTGKAPAWSPRGDELVYESVYKDMTQLHHRGLAITTTAGSLRALPGTREYDRAPDWGVNDSIAFVRRARIYITRPNSATPVQLLGVRADSPDWAPNGKRLAFTRLGRAPSIWTVKADGGGRRRITRNAFSPAWSPDGSRIVFTRRRSLWVMRANGRRQHRIVRGLHTGDSVSSESWVTVTDADWQPIP